MLRLSLPPMWLATGCPQAAACKKIVGLLPVIYHSLFLTPMSRKGGKKKITLENIQNQMLAINNELQATHEEIRTTKKELIEHMDKRFDEHEVYFTAIQEDLIELKGTTKRLEEKTTKLEGEMTEVKETVGAMKKDLSEFRAETQSFHSGMAAKSGRQDAVIFKLTGILKTKNILSNEQSAGLRTL